MKKRIRKGFFSVILAFMICDISVSATALTDEENAQSMEKAKETIEEALDFQEADEMLRDLFPDKNLTVGQILERIFDGDFSFSAEDITQAVRSVFLSEWNRQKQNLGKIIFLILIAAVFSNFSRVFHNRQASEIGFYVIFLFLFTMMIGSFQTVISETGERLTCLTEFMKVLSPVYFIATAIASGSATSVGFYNLVLIAIFLIEVFMVKFLLPLIRVYLMISLLNQITGEQSLTKMAELLHLIVGWTQKMLLTFVVGLNVIQGIISPAVDQLKRSTLTKGAEALPVIGDALGGMTQVVLGTAIVIRNGIGVIGVVGCLTLGMAPVLELGLISLMYRVVAAVTEPVSDKRITGCLAGMSDASELLLKICFSSSVLFLITIAVVAASSGG